MTFTLDSITLGGGITQEDRHVLEHTLAQTITRLDRLGQPAQAEVSVKDRGSADPRTTLEVWIHGLPRLVATSSERHVKDALNEVNAAMVAQITELAARREPRNNRLHRDTIRS